MGVAADPRDVTDCPERAKVIRDTYKAEHRYQTNEPGASLHECSHLPDVIWRAFPAGTLTPATLELRKPNNSVLLAGSRRNCDQLGGSFVLPATFLQTPSPCFSLVDSFRLSGV